MSDGESTVFKLDANNSIKNEFEHSHSRSRKYIYKSLRAKDLFK